MNCERVQIITGDMNITLEPILEDAALVGFQIRRGTDELRELREIRQAAQNTVDYGFSQYYQDELRALLKLREQYVEDTAALLERKEQK